MNRALPKTGLIVYLLQGCGVLSSLINLRGFGDEKDLLLFYNVVYKLLVPSFLVRAHVANSFSQAFQNVD